MFRGVPRAARAATFLLCVCGPVFSQGTSPADTIWNTPVNAVAGPNSLTKTGGCDGCYDAGASTKDAATSGNAYAEFTFSETAGFRVVGFSHAFSVTDGNTIDFGIRIQAGYAEVREKGVYRTETSAEPG